MVVTQSGAATSQLRVLSLPAERGLHEIDFSHKLIQHIPDYRQITREAACLQSLTQRRHALRTNLSTTSLQAMRCSLQRLAVTALQRRPQGRQERRCLFEEALDHPVQEVRIFFPTYVAKHFQSAWV